MKIHYMTWEEYTYTIEEIIREIKESGKKYTMIGSFLRGGLIPAVQIANALDIHDIRILNDIPFEYYNDLSPREMLVVDDISDSGDTLYDYRMFDIACLTYKIHTKVVPTYHSVSFEPDEWVTFPWERKKDIKMVRDRDRNVRKN